MATTREGGLHRCASRVRCQDLVCAVLRSDSRKRRTAVGQYLPSPPGGCVRPSLPRAGHGIGSLQWCAWPEGAVGARAFDDARIAATTTPSLSARTRWPTWLGVQRPSITDAAAELDRAGFIRRGREQVTIVNRQGLMAASCECYQLVRTRTAHHLPKTFPEAQIFLRARNVHYRQRSQTGLVLNERIRGLRENHESSCAHLWGKLRSRNAEGDRAGLRRRVVGHCSSLPR